MPFSLEQFGAVLQTRNPAGKPYVIIGGQAVNYWATRYLTQETKLSNWQPFTSKDIDFYGNRQDVLRVAAQLRCPAVFPHRKMRTAFAGGIAWPIGTQTARVEFVQRIPGGKAQELEKLAIEHEHLGQPVRVIDPISLMLCKLTLALTVDQNSRRDIDHARILGLCTLAFLRETLRGVETGELPARGWLGATERVLKMAESKIGRRAARELSFPWSSVLPETEISASNHRQIVRFRMNRLKQWREKLQQQSVRRKSS